MNKENQYTKGIGIGMMIGAVIGIVTDNIALWLSLGLVFGAGYSKHRQSKIQDSKDNEV